MERFPWVAIMGWSRLCELLWDAAGSAGWGRPGGLLGAFAPSGEGEGRETGGWKCRDAPGTSGGKKAVGAMAANFTWVLQKPSAASPGW